MNLYLIRVYITATASGRKEKGVSSLAYAHTFFRAGTVRNLLTTDGGGATSYVPKLIFGKHADDARKADAIQSQSNLLTSMPRVGDAAAEAAAAGAAEAAAAEADATPASIALVRAARPPPPPYHRSPDHRSFPTPTNVAPSVPSARRRKRPVAMEYRENFEVLEGAVLHC